MEKIKLLNLQKMEVKYLLIMKIKNNMSRYYNLDIKLKFNSKFYNF